MCFGELRDSIVIPLHNCLHHLLAHLLADALAFGVTLLEGLLLDVHHMFMRAAKNFDLSRHADR